MDKLYQSVSFATSKLITKSYSTSFSLSILLLGKKLRDPIYGVYGFVRLADEIVDTYHGSDKKELLENFRQDTLKAIDKRVSLNPVLHAFQEVVHEYNIELKLIEDFIRSMEMDLDMKAHDRQSYENYIYGSAEVVGLMCLKIFVNGDALQYKELKESARSLGAAFQKVNFLRDMKDDYLARGRTYFPGVAFTLFDEEALTKICADIEMDFSNAYEGIIALPKDARLGVYTAYTYYRMLFNKIRKLNTEEIRNSRVRIPNHEKLALVLGNYLKLNLSAVRNS
jgi:15-cis-phytoene synthase